MKITNTKKKSKNRKMNSSVNPAFKQGYVEKLFKKRKYQEVLDAISSMDLSSQNNLNNVKIKGECFYKLGYWYEAIDILTQILVKEPNNLNALSMRCDSNEAVNKYKEAINDLKIFLSRKKDKNKQIKLIQFYKNVGKFDEAFEDLQKYIEDNPMNHSAYSARAEVFVELGENEKAKNDFLTSLKYAKSLHDKNIIQTSLAEIEYKKENYSDAKNIIEKVLRTEDLPQAIAILGFIKLALNDQSGISDINDLISSKRIGSFDSTLLLTKVNIVSKNYLSPVKILSNALTKYPDDVKLLCLLGLLMSKMNDHAQAINYYTEAIKYNPNYYDFYVNRSLCYTMMGNIHKAKFDLLVATKMSSPNKPTIKRIEAIINFLEKRYEQAKKIFQSLIEKGSKNEKDYYYLGIICATENDIYNSKRWLYLAASNGHPEANNVIKSVDNGKFSINLIVKKNEPNKIYQDWQFEEFENKWDETKNQRLAYDLLSNERPMEYPPDKFSSFSVRYREWKNNKKTTKGYFRNSESKHSRI